MQTPGIMDKNDMMRFSNFIKDLSWVGIVKFQKWNRKKMLRLSSKKGRKRLKRWITQGKKKKGVHCREGGKKKYGKRYV